MRGAQLTAIVWLRWRLLRNQWFRAGLFNKIFSMAIIIGSALLIIGCGTTGFLAGLFAFKSARPLAFLLTWDILSIVFLFAWLIGLMIELQRSEDIDLTRFLHLPVSLRGIFAMNYVGSYLALPTLVFVPAMTGLILGLILGKDWRMAALLPVAAGFIFIVTAWTYYLRGWLSSMLTNPRRRRTVLVVFSLSLMLIFQIPNFYFHALRKQPGTPRNLASKPPSIEKMLAVHPFLPVLWPGHVAYQAARRQIWLALPYTAALFLLGALGLQLSYRATLRFYRGQTKSRATAVRSTTAPRRAAKLLVERTLPWIPAQAGVLAVSCFRSLIRAPEVRMFLGTNLILLVVFSALLFSKLDRTPLVAQPFLISAAICLTFFSLLQILLNQFGFDRDGFRSLILLPVPRHLTLLGKNLAILPFSLTLSLLFCSLVLISTKLSLILFAAGFFQSLVAFFILTAAGNALSILVPYRIEPGSMRHNKATGTAVLVSFCTHLCFPFLSLPILIAPLTGFIVARLGYLPADWTTLLCSLLLALLASTAYAFTLPMLGRLLQRREQEILLKVTREID